jgi:hypothetical protein
MIVNRFRSLAVPIFGPPAQTRFHLGLLVRSITYISSSFGGRSNKLPEIIALRT